MREFTRVQSILTLMVEDYAEMKGSLPVAKAFCCLLEAVIEGNCSPSYAHYFLGKTTEMSR